MRYRLGFVSNSSSSSFICCYATVIDEEKALAYLKKMNNDDAEIITTEEAIKKGAGWDCYGADWAGVWDHPVIKKDKDFKYLIFESRGGAGSGDHDFLVDEDWCCDYDVDFEDFEQYEQDFINGVSEETGFSNINIGYGAGRNG